MKPQSSAPTNRLLRQSTSALKSGHKVTVGPAQASTEPAIEVTRNEQGIETIEVTCACGERIIIRCDYA